MEATLAALQAVIIDTPADRTVRLVYADALDESGDPAHAIRAEFIRAQIALEPLTGTEPEWDALAGRCDDLFREHWIDWWQPVCAAVGLPPPYVPKRRGRGKRVRMLPIEDFELQAVHECVRGRVRIDRGIRLRLFQAPQRLRPCLRRVKVSQVPRPIVPSIHASDDLRPPLAAISTGGHRSRSYA